MTPKRTTMLLDPELVAEAAGVLGTKQATETVRASLRQTVRRAQLERLTTWDFPDDADAALREQRAPRRFSE